jgi:hypothetical protein
VCKSLDSNKVTIHPASFLVPPGMEVLEPVNSSSSSGGGGGGGGKVGEWVGHI